MPFRVVDTYPIRLQTSVGIVSGELWSDRLLGIGLESPAGEAIADADSVVGEARDVGELRSGRCAASRGVCPRRHRVGRRDRADPCDLGGTAAGQTPRSSARPDLPLAASAPTMVGEGTKEVEVTLFRRKQRDDAGGASPQQMYVELRNQVLQLTPADLGEDAHEAPLLALLMETGYPEGVATLVGVVDGSASLYFSNGGGVIGAGGRAEVARATRRWLELGAGSLERLARSAEDPPPPSKGLTQFVAVTPAGLRGAVAPEGDLGEERHELSPLFHAGHDVITQIRLETD